MCLSFLYRPIPKCCLHKFWHELMRIGQWHDWRDSDHDLDETRLQPKLHILNMESKLPHTKPQQPDLNGKWPSVLTKHIFRNNSQNYSIINIAKFTGYFSLSKIGTHIRWFTICNSLIWLSFYQLLGLLPYRWMRVSVSRVGGRVGVVWE